jgi:hypothetical protein
MNAPRAVVFLIGPDWTKGPSRPKPYPSKLKPESWRPQRAIPQLDRETLRRRVRDFRQATQAQAETLRETGRRFRAAMREAATHGL